MRSISICLATLMFAACGPPDSEEGLVTDGEIDAIGTARSELNAPLTTPPSATAPAAIHVRLAWGYLAGKAKAGQWVNWTGGVTTDGGTVVLENLNFFDRGDRAVPSQSASGVSWVSRTLPHFDGLVVKVQPAAPTDVVSIRMPLFSADLTAADLAAGVEQHFVVDAAGHEVSLASVADTEACAGFAFGYERPSAEGWLAFGGLFTDSSGQVTGRLRFRVDGETVRARLMGPDKQLVASGQGSFAIAAGGGSFTLSLARPDGTGAGVVRGLFHSPSYSPRGSFQATVACQ